MANLCILNFYDYNLNTYFVIRALDGLIVINQTKLEICSMPSLNTRLPYQFEFAFLF